MAQVGCWSDSAESIPLHPGFRGRGGENRLNDGIDDVVYSGGRPRVLSSSTGADLLLRFAELREELREPLSEPSVVLLERVVAFVT